MAITSTAKPRRPAVRANDTAHSTCSNLPKHHRPRARRPRSSSSRSKADSLTCSNERLNAAKMLTITNIAIAATVKESVTWRRLQRVARSPLLPGCDLLQRAYARRSLHRGHRDQRHAAIHEAHRGGSHRACRVAHWGTKQHHVAQHPARAAPLRLRRWRYQHPPAHRARSARRSIHQWWNQAPCVAHATCTCGRHAPIRSQRASQRNQAAERSVQYRQQARPDRQRKASPTRAQ